MKVNLWKSSTGIWYSKQQVNKIGYYPTLESVFLSETLHSASWVDKDIFFYLHEKKNLYFYG